MLGQTVSHYRIVEKLGEGGMGVVYKARDLRLDRFVALKFLAPHLGSSDEDKQRFVREAKAASALDHPNICTIHEIDETELGQLYIVMAHYDGETLDQQIARGPLAIDEAVSIAEQLGRGLARAHGAGIVHRDVKPGNVIVLADGTVKLLDFGLAKLRGGSRLTAKGATAGTLAYMAPEELEGEEATPASDTWALGVVLYEMAAGRHPFDEAHEAAMLYSIVNEAPEEIKQSRPDTPEELQRIIHRAMEKKASGRYPSALELARELSAFRTASVRLAEGEAAVSITALRRPRVLIPALVSIALAAAGTGWFFHRQARIAWARDEALPEIRRLAESENYTAAFSLAVQAGKFIPGDPRLKELESEISTAANIVTDPAGAEVYYKPYRDLDGEWRLAGLSPIENVSVPSGLKRWRISKPGFEPIDFAVAVTGPLGVFTLRAEGSPPPGMVAVSGNRSPLWLYIFSPDTRRDVADFLIDRFEVTNKEFQAFVDEGGYTNRSYWKQRFLDDGRESGWEQALDRFRDKTGRPGPANWELGRYPEGLENHPVGGVSWYEAAAYAEFAGKSLPTIFHWAQAALGSATDITALSRFGGEGTAPVGTSHAISAWGVDDLAGNVREWCWNANQDGRRFVLGGAWDDATYTFQFPLNRDPFDRSPSNGFRCMRSVEGTPPSADSLLPVDSGRRDYRKEKPAPEGVFQAYKAQFSYDPSTLDAVVEHSDESHSAWTKQKISFAAAYSGEQVIAYLFLPKTASPPFQTVVVFPGSNANAMTSSGDGAALRGFPDYVVKSGRAVLYPIYKGTYERKDGIASTWPDKTHRFVEYLTMWVKDFRRSIDYLETREEIDATRLGYFGFSWGGRMGAFIPAVEPRLKVAVFQLGGLASAWARPEADQINFVSRVRIPVLMLNGRHDSIYPVEGCQLPMFRSLGTPAEHKRHIVYETFHDLPRNEAIKETLDWLDRYLGPVQ
jgi:dienelactone hydrolase